MTCQELAPLLDELVDGTLDDARARAVHGHIVGCAACAERLASLETMVAAARELEPMDPPPSMWDGIAARLDEEQRADAERPRLWWWWKAWGRTLLFGGAAVAVAASALVMVLSHRRAAPVAAATRPALAATLPTADALYDQAVKELEQADADYVHAISDLKGIVDSSRASWPADVAKTFDDNLASIDAAVQRQRDAFRTRPGDPAAADALASAERKEIDYLQEAALR